ncbi:hypothetical protein J3E69DRAFT_218988 [Trichoderma sp. SZMC 28015]
MHRLLPAGIHGSIPLICPQLAYNVGVIVMAWAFPSTGQNRASDMAKKSTIVQSSSCGIGSASACTLSRST